jgi:hypothetical protein
MYVFDGRSWVTFFWQREEEMGGHHLLQEHYTGLEY